MWGELTEGSMDFIRDFAGLFCLSVGGNIAGQAAGQISVKKTYAAIAFMFLVAAGAIALGYLVAIDQTTTMFQIAGCLFALSFFCA